MATPFLGQITMYAFNFAPRSWALCDGQILPINQNQALYSLLGTTFGGDGRTTFGLPDLRSRVSIHVGDGHTLGQRSGEETHTLSIQEMPPHNHRVEASSTNADSPVPTNNVLASANNVYHAPDGNLVSLRTGSVLNAGGGQAHDNMQPYGVLNFCIALQGIFPSRN